MRTSKNDKVDISTLMQSVDNTETLNTETDKIAKLIEATSQLNKCLLSVVEQLKNITSQPIELSVKQSDMDQFRLVKNGYIQEETELLKKHVAKQLAMIKAHEQRICEVCKQGEGIWLSDFWLKVWGVVQIVVYGVITLYLMAKSS
ncbi:hypothetical protein I6E38_03995 [Prevotella stercorea]|uniref:hypothetical protein n=1 Tax=Leyella stercorea TaxID=363265 RepID=UPI001F2FAA43|nr:hypothetical protein [Leyella stercorea]MCF2578282.1 hypothetical protein [Leyella stercorea]